MYIPRSERQVHIFDFWSILQICPPQRLQKFLVEEVVYRKAATPACTLVIQCCFDKYFIIV